MMLSGTAQGRILVVDDEPTNVKLLSVRLVAAGYEVLVAYNGDEALRVVRENGPDVVLLDVMMPGMNGYQVAARIKHDPETAMIPVILVTALSDVADKVLGFDSGADDFLAKPVNQAELVARIRSLIKLKRLREELETQRRAQSLFPSEREEVPPEKRLILIVEDAGTDARYYEHVLHAAGHGVVIAQDCRAAVRALEGPLPDLILLDLLLPDMSGVELLAVLRGRPELESVPILIASSVADLEMKVRGLEAGADDYLVKPINSLELVARVKSNLHKHEIQQRLKRSADRFFQQSITDPLTGLFNVRYLNTILEREVATAIRHGHPFSLLLLDIDDFKSVNDTLGHAVGDSVLREIGGILRELTRGCDVAARYGGEEFVIVLSSIALPGSLVAAEKFRKAIAEHGFAAVAGRVITVSVGVAAFGGPEDTRESIKKRADDALYVAKREGKNRVQAQP